MKEEQYLQLLDTVKPVGAPPFLLTRIQARISNFNPDTVSPRLAWAMAASLLLVIAINSLVVFEGRSRGVEGESIAAVAQTMNLINNDNSLYN